jgi:hypothetical protein
LEVPSGLGFISPEGTWAVSPQFIRGAGLDFMVIGMGILPIGLF